MLVDVSKASSTEMLLNGATTKENREGESTRTETVLPLKGLGDSDQVTVRHILKHMQELSRATGEGFDDESIKKSLLSSSDFQDENEYLTSLESALSAESVSQTPEFTIIGLVHLLLISRNLDDRKMGLKTLVVAADLAKTLKCSACMVATVVLAGKAPDASAYDNQTKDIQRYLISLLQEERFEGDPERYVALTILVQALKVADCFPNEFSDFFQEFCKTYLNEAVQKPNEIMEHAQNQGPMIQPKIVFSSQITMEPYSALLPKQASHMCASFESETEKCSLTISYPLHIFRCLQPQTDSVKVVLYDPRIFSRDLERTQLLVTVSVLYWWSQTTIEKRDLVNCGVVLLLFFSPKRGVGHACMDHTLTKPKKARGTIGCNRRYIVLKRRSR
eukprot:scaffold4979_cov73-Cylindrotheca_fusiformis.AAC.6